MNSYDIQVETGINSSKFEYVYDESENRRVITQVKNYPNMIGINGDEYEYDANEDNYVKIDKTEKEKND
tara:strand:+ start:351 stop:557 length:207 start_codon:yes stop_codon:yes gene_type:complete